MLSSDVGRRPEPSHGVVTYHKVTLKKKHRRNHSQRTSGERESEKGTTANEPVVRENPKKEPQPMNQL